MARMAARCADQVCLLRVADDLMTWGPRKAWEVLSYVSVQAYHTMRQRSFSHGVHACPSADLLQAGVVRSVRLRGR